MRMALRNFTTFIKTLFQITDIPSLQYFPLWTQRQRKMFFTRDKVEFLILSSSGNGLKLESTSHKTFYWSASENVEKKGGFIYTLLHINLSIFFFLKRSVSWYLPTFHFNLITTRGEKGTEYIDTMETKKSNSRREKIYQKHGILYL